jgi:hypothetical protein
VISSFVVEVNEFVFFNGTRSSLFQPKFSIVNNVNGVLILFKLPKLPENTKLTGSLSSKINATNARRSDQVAASIVNTTFNVHTISAIVEPDPPATAQQQNLPSPQNFLSPVSSTSNIWRTSDILMSTLAGKIDTLL